MSYDLYNFYLYRPMTHYTQNCKEINDHLTSVSFQSNWLSIEPFTEAEKVEMLWREHIDQIEAMEDALLERYRG